MKKLIVADEQIMCAQELFAQFKVNRKNKKFPYKSALITGDDSFLCDYFLFALSKADKKYPAFEKITYVSDDEISEYRRDFISASEISVLNFNDAFKSSKKLVFFFVDCKTVENKTETIENLKKVLSACVTGTKVIVSVLLPGYDSFSDICSATSLAEREFSFYLEKQCKRTPEIDYYLEVESLCRASVNATGADINLLRFDNVFAPDVYSCELIDVEAIVNDVFENKKITITDDDFKTVFSVSYVRDACSDILYAACYGKKGHIYNVASQEITLADLKEQIYSSYSDQFSLEKNLSAKPNRNYYCINTLKFDFLRKEKNFDLSAMIRHIVSYQTELEYDCSDNVSFYTGRIGQIQAVEIEMLKEIDRICVENDIKYFLAGGTLLGAVRSGGAIPWDDDLDIGMLRKDYDKFRKVCKTQLSPQYSYSCPFNGSGSHYTTEKVRLDPTYFSTKYSSANVFPDGLFIDILIYDKTSNIKLFQKLHTMILGILYNCVILRWNHRPWINRRHGVVKVIAPLLKLFPWGFYHHLFEFFSKIYKNKKNAKWLIDTVGKKLKDGPLPIDGLEDTVYVAFDGIEAPIPVDYTGYLNYAYGPNYMQKPNFSNRKCPHDFARIDLGKYIFDKKGTTPFRDVDIRGELYETETQV